MKKIAAIVSVLIASLTYGQNDSALIAENGDVTTYIFDLDPRQSNGLYTDFFFMNMNSIQYPDYVVAKKGGLSIGAGLKYEGNNWLSWRSSAMYFSWTDSWFYNGSGIESEFYAAITLSRKKARSKRNHPDLVYTLNTNYGPSSYINSPMLVSNRLVIGVDFDHWFDEQLTGVTSLGIGLERRVGSYSDEGIHNHYGNVDKKFFLRTAANSMVGVKLLLPINNTLPTDSQFVHQSFGAELYFSSNISIVYKLKNFSVPNSASVTWSVGRMPYKFRGNVVYGVGFKAGFLPLPGLSEHYKRIHYSMDNVISIDPDDRPNW